MNEHVDGLRNVLAWPVFVMSQDDERAFIRWARSQEHRRLIEAFALAPRESLQVYLNAACAVVDAHRDIGMMITGLADLAACIPVASREISVDCASNLPEDLRHLTKYLSRWAVADDQERSERIMRASEAFRARLRADVEPSLGRIDEYLDSCSQPLPECALRVSYLAELAVELRIRRLTSR